MKYFYIDASVQPRRDENKLIRFIDGGERIRCVIKATDEVEARKLFDEQYPNIEKYNSKYWAHACNIVELTNPIFEIEHSYWGS